MKTSHLHDIWGGPDNTRLTKQQFSFRLPVHIAAKLAALCELYPQKNRTQIVADLLTAALDDLEENLPEGLGERENQVDALLAEELGLEVGDILYSLGGVRGNFRNLANRYYREMEEELGNDTPGKLYGDMVVTEDQFKK
ncbi:MAG: hypothetical protein WC340_14735 [Kiritimatiellia bacterium]